MASKINHSQRAVAQELFTASRHQIEKGVLFWLRCTTTLKRMAAASKVLHIAVLREL